MGTVKKIARRGFLIGSAAITGGVIFGLNKVKTPHANPMLANLSDGEAAITPFVKIDASGITLITPQNDKGQGVYSAQAMLIAEELDVDLDQVKIDPGLPANAYYNAAFADEAAEFMAKGDPERAETIHKGLSAVIKTAGIQGTGGSTSMSAMFDRMLKAGASARETLKLAASEKTGVAVADLKTERGSVILPDGTQIAYTELASAAAKTPVVQDVPLRDRSQWRLVGKPAQRLDIVGKSTGTLPYGIDMKREDMLHATVVLNPAQGGSIESFDEMEARDMQGVRDVMEVTGGFAVIADNTWTAMQAAQKVSASWGKAPFPDTMEEHWQTLAESFIEDRQDSQHRNDGDVEAALEGGEVVAAEYRAPYLAHAPLEPINATVHITDESAEVWIGTQMSGIWRDIVADMTGLDKDSVTIHALYMGGSFGHRLEPDALNLCTEIAMKHKGTPIKLTYSREEDISHDYVRQIAMARFQGSVRNGQVDALDLGIAMPSVFGSQMGRLGMPMAGPDNQIVAGAWDQPFAIPNQRVTGYRAPELAPISSWRSVGASTNGFFYNSALEELIEAAGADPMEERLRLASGDAVATGVLEAVAEMSGWNGVKNGSKGRGVAFTTSFLTPTAVVVETSEINGRIKIDNVWVAADVGTVVDPVNFDNQVKGGVVFALGHAMNCEVTYENGISNVTNYHTYEAMRMFQTPQIEVRGLENKTKISGMGEPMVPPTAPALAGAIHALTGQRLREMPFNKFVDFV